MKKTGRIRVWRGEKWVIIPANSEKGIPPKKFKKTYSSSFKKYKRRNETQVKTSRPIQSKKGFFTRTRHIRRLNQQSFGIFVYSKGSNQWTRLRNFKYPTQQAALIAKTKIFGIGRKDIRVRELKRLWN